VRAHHGARERPEPCAVTRSEHVEQPRQRSLALLGEPLGQPAPAAGRRIVFTLCGLHPGDTVHLVVNDPFRALSHPIRRGIVERLAAGPATVGDATAGFGVSKPAISKHLRVLEETGVLTRVVEGRTHRLSIEPDVLSEAADWMDRQRAVWERMFDVVDEYLKEDAPR
jgi:DNA-binding transcriptional ArsR family regulator